MVLPRRLGRIIRGLAASLARGLRERRLSLHSADERLAWMIVIATIPVGLTGVALEHTFRTLFAKPAAAAVFLFINGLVLLGAELLRRARLRRDTGAAEPPAEVAAAAPAMATAAAGRSRPGAHAKWAGWAQLGFRSQRAA